MEDCSKLRKCYLIIIDSNVEHPPNYTNGRALPLLVHPTEPPLVSEPPPAVDLQALQDTGQRNSICSRICSQRPASASSLHFGSTSLQPPATT